MFGEEYILHLKIINNHLFKIGKSVLDWDLILYGLGGLDSIYNLFVSSFTIRQELVTLIHFIMNCLPTKGIWIDSILMRFIQLYKKMLLIWVTWISNTTLILISINHIVIVLVSSEIYKIFLKRAILINRRIKLISISIITRTRKLLVIIQDFSAKYLEKQVME